MNLNQDQEGKDPIWKSMLYNHWTLVIRTAPVKNSVHKRIVGFNVLPSSYKNKSDVDRNDPLKDNHEKLYLEDLKKGEDGNYEMFEFSY